MKWGYPEQRFRMATWRLYHVQTLEYKNYKNQQKREQSAARAVAAGESSTALRAVNTFPTTPHEQVRSASPSGVENENKVSDSSGLPSSSGVPTRTNYDPARDVFRP